MSLEDLAMEPQLTYPVHRTRLTLNVFGRSCHGTQIFLLYFQQADVSFSIFHINDIHAHFEEVDVYTGRCREEMATAGECYGGMARLYTKMMELQQQEENWLFLNAGDYYQVTKKLGINDNIDTKQNCVYLPNPFQPFIDTVKL